MNIVSMPLSRKDIRYLTKELRKIAGLEEKTYFPIIEFIELILVANEGMEFEIVESYEMQDTYGTTNTSQNKMFIRNDVYEGAIQGNPRDRFTLCHELAHYLLHQPDTISYARGNVPKYRDPEWQANTFAAELMAPYDLIKNMSINEIMKKCGMSRQAAKIQYNIIHNR